MKAKDYAIRYISNPVDGELASIAFDMFIETRDLADQRHAKSNSALFAILNEIDNKWRAFVNLVPDCGLNVDGFAGLVEIKLPDVYFYWKEYRCNTGQGKLP